MLGYTKGLKNVLQKVTSTFQKWKNIDGWNFDEIITNDVKLLHFLEEEGFKLPELVLGKMHVYKFYCPCVCRKLTYNFASFGCTKNNL